MRVTVKQVIEAARAPRFKGRYVINGCQVFTLRVVGMIMEIKEFEKFVDHNIFNGTGYIDGRVWFPGVGQALYKSSFKDARIHKYYEICANLTVEQDVPKLSIVRAMAVENFNLITEHFLSVIMEHCMLRDEGSQRAAAKVDDSSGSASRVAMDLDKEAIIWMLAEDDIRDSEAGASFDFIVGNMHMDVAKVKTILDELISEGSVYHTVDESHYKLCLDSE